MSSLNEVTLIGNIGRDPEFTQTQDGRKFARLSLATSERWKDKNTGERREKTEWHRVVIFNDNLVSLTERFLRKGSKVYLRGKLQTRKWQAQDGSDRYSTEIVLSQYQGQIVMLDGKDASAATGDRGQQQPQAKTAAPMDLDDDIPF